MFVEKRSDMTKAQSLIDFGMQFMNHWKRSSSQNIATIINSLG